MGSGSGSPPELLRAFDFHKADRFPEAEGAYRAVLARMPNYPAALHGLGLVNHQLGRAEEAVSLLKRAVAGLPRHAEFRCNLAAVLGALDRHAEAEAELQEAVRLNPNYAEAWCNLGVALEKRGAAADAVDAYQKAIDLKPEYAQACNFRGNALRRLGRLREAELAHREAIRLEPKSAGAWGALASTLSGQGRLKEVIEARRKVAALRPKSASVASALLATMHYDSSCSPADLLEAARSWSADHAARFMDDHKPFENDPDPGRRLRLGFVSGNLTAHPEGRLLRPILANLDRTRFETFVYTSTGRGDGITSILRQLCDTWHDIDSMRDGEVAGGIREDRIDILVDLGGHFGNNRMQLLARKPAPVQVIHFGYPGTSGMPQVDWRLTDEFADPREFLTREGRAPYTTEKLLYLPGLAWCYEPPLEARSVGALPALVNGHITFCSANNTMKLTEEALEVWSRILKRLPDSKLQVLAEGGKRQDASTTEERGRHLIDVLGAYGIDSHRITLMPRMPRPNYFEWIHSCDIALDPFPYNGGVTSCDTLWMGVPLVTLSGNSYWSRQGAALLGNIGLGDAVALNADEYVEQAIRMASDLPTLAKLRLSLRQRLTESPVTDCAAFAKKLEEGLRFAWKQWCETTPLFSHEPVSVNGPTQLALV